MQVGGCRERGFLQKVQAKFKIRLDKKYKAVIVKCILPEITGTPFYGKK